MCVTAPLAFKADVLPVLVLTLDSDAASATPQPSVLYPDPAGLLALNSRFVEWHLVPQPGTPAIRIDRDGLIRAVHPGKARVEASYGKTTATLRVIVRLTQQ
jgi:hypothetical protein